MNSRTIVFLVTLLLLPGSLLISRAQDDSTTAAPQADSVADAARKARAQKKDSTKAVKTYTDDNVDDIKGTISIVGAEPADANKTDDKKEDAKAENAGAEKAEGKQDESYWRAKFASARRALADDSKELDILQREFNLKQEQYYQDPNAALKQQYSREDVDKAQADIDTKKQDVAKDKQVLADLEEDLRKAGGDPGWANEPSGAGPSESSNSNSNSSASTANETGANTPDSGSAPAADTTKLQ
jgi:hypothetical protein